MFRLKNLGNTLLNATKTLLPPQALAAPPQVPAPHDCKENTYVYIWKLTPEGVGHTALQVGKDKACVYVSIHPGFIPAVGPTIIWPLPASISVTLKDDMASEAAAKQHDVCTGSMNGESTTSLQYTPLPSSLPADQIIEIRGLNTDAIRKEIAIIKEGVEIGNTYYQLLPRINTLGFFKALPAYISQDPVDMEIARRTTVSAPATVYNCATLVGHLLEVGGAPAMPRSNMPWVPTPNDISEYAQRLTRLS